MFQVMRSAVDRATANAFNDVKDALNPRVSVLRHESFGHLPPCLFIVAELDPLHDDSLSTSESIHGDRDDMHGFVSDYQKKLEQAGVKTELIVVKGVPHAYFTLPGETNHTRADGSVV